MLRQARSPSSTPTARCRPTSSSPSCTSSRSCRTAGFRRVVLDDLCDGLFTRGWWSSYYDRLSAHEREEYINPVLTKMALFSTLPTARRILGQPRSTLDLAAAIMGGAIVIVKLAKGRSRRDLAGLVGALLGEYVDLAIERAGRPARRPAAAGAGGDRRAAGRARSTTSGWCASCASTAAGSCCARRSSAAWRRSCRGCARSSSATRPGCCASGWPRPRASCWPASWTSG